LPDRSTLYQITDCLLHARADDYKTLLETSSSLYSTLIQLVDMNDEEEGNRKNLDSGKGIAIGTTWAAMCIKDLLRTKKFMDGIFHAVQYLKEKQPNRPLHILYAGTGPFATLVLPLFKQFTSDELRFTFLEINHSSYTCLQTLVTKLGVQPYIREVVHTDACTYTIPTEQEPDLLICETMQQGLEKEPQVSLVSHLVPQLKKECILIPEQIGIEAALTNDSVRMKIKMGELPADTHCWKSKATVFELSKDTVLNNLPAAASGKWPATTVHFPADLVSRFPSLYLLTTITVFGDDVLLPDACALTLPLLLKNFSGIEKDLTVQFNYETGSRPGIRYSIDDE
jgi:hypothetical protein